MGASEKSAAVRFCPLFPTIDAAFASCRMVAVHCANQSTQILEHEWTARNAEAETGLEIPVLAHFERTMDSYVRESWYTVKA